MGHSLYTETKGGEGAVEEERGEGRATGGERGERWMVKGGGTTSCFLSGWLLWCNFKR